MNKRLSEKLIIDLPSRSTSEEAHFYAALVGPTIHHFVGELTSPDHGRPEKHAASKNMLPIAAALPCKRRDQGAWRGMETKMTNSGFYWPLTRQAEREGFFLKKKPAL